MSHWTPESKKRKEKIKNWHNETKIFIDHSMEMLINGNKHAIFVVHKYHCCLNFYTPGLKNIIDTLAFVCTMLANANYLSHFWSFSQKRYGRLHRKSLCTVLCFCKNFSCFTKPFRLINKIKSKTRNWWKCKTCNVHFDNKTTFNCWDTLMIIVWKKTNIFAPETAIF